MPKAKRKAAKKTRATRKTRTVSRAAKTGKFVKKSYAKKHPATTKVERVRVKKKKSKGKIGDVGSGPHGSGDGP